MAKIQNLTDVAPTGNDLVLQELQSMKAKIASLESSNEELKKASRIGSSNEQVNYNGPLMFSLKTWNDKIISDYVSKKKEQNKDWVYKNQYGEWIDNQMMILTYIDGSTEEVMYTQFWAGLQKTEKIYTNGSIKSNPNSAPIISRNTNMKLGSDGKQHEFFIFDIDGERVEICEKCIN